MARLAALNLLSRLFQVPSAGFDHAALGGFGEQAQGLVEIGFAAAIASQLELIGQSWPNRGGDTTGRLDFGNGGG